MAGFSKVIVYGNLTRDPDHRVTPTGLAITKISIAVSRSYKGTDGNQKDEVAYIDADAFGKTAETISNNFTKGKPIIIEGRLRQDSWETPSGEKRNKLVVVVDSFHFVSGGRQEGEQGSTQSYSQSGNDNRFDQQDPYAAGKKPSYQKSNTRPQVNHSETIEEDDIPF